MKASCTGILESGNCKDEPLQKCKQCGKYFPSVNTLNQHLSETCNPILNTGNTHSYTAWKILYLDPIEGGNCFVQTYTHAHVYASIINTKIQ